MTSKEKAADIVDKYIQLLPYYSKESNLKRAKASALLTVDEILDTISENYSHIDNKTYEFWEEVKQEIINL